MGFKENLKDELKYQGVLVKELAAKSGVPKGTIDHYLAEKSASPIAENAVKIARALNVSVEYLVTGKDSVPSKNNRPPYSAQILALAEKLSHMDQKQLNLSATIIDAIQNSVSK